MQNSIQVTIRLKLAEDAGSWGEILKNLHFAIDEIPDVEYVESIEIEVEGNDQ